MDRNRHVIQSAVTLLAVAVSIFLAACSGGTTSTAASGTSSVTSSSGDSSESSSSVSSGDSSSSGDSVSEDSSGGALASATYVLSWDVVNDANVTGYRVYFSTSPLNSGYTPQHVDVSLQTNSIELSPATYNINAGTTVYAAVVSTGAGGLESPLSNMQSVVVE